MSETKNSIIDLFFKELKDAALCCSMHLCKSKYYFVLSYGFLLAPVKILQDHKWMF